MTEYKLQFSKHDDPFVVQVEHDPEETGIDVDYEFDRFIELKELESRGSPLLRPEDFVNYLWYELGLLAKEA